LTHPTDSRRFPSLANLRPSSRSATEALSSSAASVPLSSAELVASAAKLRLSSPLQLVILLRVPILASPGEEESMQVGLEIMNGEFKEGERGEEEGGVKFLSLVA
ncbi:hypothetical protein NL676_009551, partial [Syzygium grande]